MLTLTLFVVPCKCVFLGIADSHSLQFTVSRLPSDFPTKLQSFMTIFYRRFVIRMQKYYTKHENDLPTRIWNETATNPRGDRCQSEALWAQASQQTLLQRETRAKTQDNITSEHWEELGRNPNDEPTRSARPTCNMRIHCSTPKPTIEATKQTWKQMEPRPRPSTTQHNTRGDMQPRIHVAGGGSSTQECCMQHRHKDNIHAARYEETGGMQKMRETYIGVMMGTCEPRGAHEKRVCARACRSQLYLLH